MFVYFRSNLTIRGLDPRACTRVQMEEEFVTTNKCMILFALITGLAGSLSAATLFNNGLSNQSGGTDLNANLAADNFVFASAHSVNLIRFWTLQADASSYAGATEWSVRNNAAGPQPGSVVQSGSFVSNQSLTGNSALGLPEYVHTGAVSINLAAGNYWLVLHNGPSASQPATEFYWAFTNGQTGDAAAWELSNPGTWGPISAELAFQLEGGTTNPVPEPATTALVGAGVAALAVCCRHRRSA